MSETSQLLPGPYQPVQPAHDPAGLFENAHEKRKSSRLALGGFCGRTCARHDDLRAARTLDVILGQIFSVDIDITNVTDLYAFQFDLEFAPGVLSAVAVTEGGFLPSGGTTAFVPGTIDNFGGSITSTGDSLIGMIPGVNDSGVLATVDFLAVGVGISQ